MKRKYLTGPLVCTFTCWTYGNGILPLLPLYAIERGASPGGTGLFLAFTFLCLALGTTAAGLLPKGFTHRRLLIAASGVLTALLTFFIAQTTTLIWFAVSSGACWFFAGIVLSQSATLVGLAAGPEERGTAFGILGMTNGLGSLVGGLGIGYAAEQFGFRGVFGGTAVFCLLIVVGALLSVESSAPVESPQEGDASERRRIGGVFGAGVLLLMIAQLALSVTNSTGALGRSLSMNQLGLSKLTIDLTASVVGVVGLGVPLFLGWLSDRLPKRWILVGTFLLSGASLVVLSLARVPWQFYTFAGLFAFVGVAFGIGPAYVMDLVPRESAGRAVSLFQSMFWIGNIAGMAGGGFAFGRLGVATPLLLSSLFAAAGIVLLLLIRKRPAPAKTPVQAN